jgi:hypothetical protein
LGLYSAENFDIHRDPTRFVRVMAGYALISDKELGMNTYVKHIMLKGEDKKKEVKLYLGR